MAADYVHILDEVFGLGVSCSGDPSIYTNIEWGSENPIDKTTLDSANLGLAKLAKLQSLALEASTDIRAGFASVGSGVQRWYDSREVEDQVNLIGAVVMAQHAASPIAFWCRLVASDVEKSSIEHDGAQMTTVLADGVLVKQLALAEFNGLKVAVLGCATEEEVNSFSYTSPRTGIQVPT